MSGIFWVEKVTAMYLPYYRSMVDGQLTNGMREGVKVETVLQMVGAERAAVLPQSWLGKYVRVETATCSRLAVEPWQRRIPRPRV